MKSTSFIWRGAWGPQFLVFTVVGLTACNDYNCADTATCNETPNANQPEAGANVGADAGTSGESSGRATEASSSSAILTTNSSSSSSSELAESTAGEDSTNFSSSTSDAKSDVPAPTGTGQGTTAESESSNGVVTTEDSSTVESKSLGSECSADVECASEHCVDGVCCDSPCDGVCSFCNGEGQAGQCITSASDSACGQLSCQPDSECRSFQGVELQNNCLALGECRTEAQCQAIDAELGSNCAGGEGQCNGVGECVVADKLGLGQTCSTADECGSGSCAFTASGGKVCCSSACEGTCQACGADGQCNKAPARDDACDFSCPNDTSCATYPDAPNNNCAGFGVCLSQVQFCSPSYLREGTTCGASNECDGAGECLYVDKTPPRVVTVTPDDGGTDVDRDVVIEVTFSEPIDDTTIDGAVTLYGPDGEVDATVTLLDSTTLAVSPNVSLPLITEHQVELSSAIKDVAGNSLSGAPHRSVFTTRDGVWDTSPKLLETNNASSAWGPLLATDSVNNVVAVWNMSGNAEDVWWARFDNASQTWAAGAKLVGDRSLRGFATLPNGDFLILLAERVSPFSLTSRKYTASTRTWGGAVLVETTSDSIDDVDLAYSANGDVMAVWTQQSSASPAEYSLMSSTYASGVWSAPKTVVAAQSEPFHLRPPQVALDSGGNAICVWGRGTQVYRASLTNGGASWTAAAALDSGQPADDVTISSDPGGDFYAAWRRLDEPTRGAPVVRRLGGFGNNWGAATVLRPGSGFATYEQAVVGSGSGDAVAYWYGSAEDAPYQYLVYTSEYSAASGTWGTPVGHTPIDDSFDARFPEMAMDGRGNGLLVWSQPTDTEFKQYAHRYVKGVGWGDIREFHAPSNVADFNVENQVSIAPDGEATVVWPQYDGTRYNLWALRFH